jgi:hypothetical protein
MKPCMQHISELEVEVEELRSREQWSRHKIKRLIQRAQELGFGQALLSVVGCTGRKQLRSYTS